MKCNGLPLLLFLALSLSAHSQTQKEYNPEREILILKTCPGHMISGPIPLLTSAYGFLLETPLSKKTAIELGFSEIGEGPALYFIGKQLSQPYHTISFLAKGVELQFACKYYFSKKKRLAPKGFYVAPLIQFSTGGIGQTYNYMARNNYVGFTNCNINAIYGFQQIRKNGRGFVVDYYLGLGYKKITAERHYATGYPVPMDLSKDGYYGSPLSLVGGIYLGWGFSPKEKK